MRRGALLLLLFALIAASPRAAQRTLTPREVDEALLIGSSRIAADRARFHAPYRIVVSRPPVDYIEVVTPFRRVVLAAEERLRIGERSPGQKEALDLLAAAGGQFDFVIELTFHPLNTFVGIPAYDVVLMRGANRIPPETIDRVPRFGARVEGQPPAVPIPSLGVVPGGTQPMLGGTITARFDGEAIDPEAAMDLVLTDQGKELGRARVDLGRLR